MTQKPGEFSDSVLLEDYGDHPTPASTVQMLEIYPGDKEQFQVARLQNQPRNLRTVDHARRNPSTVFLKYFGMGDFASPEGWEDAIKNRGNSVTVNTVNSIRGPPVSY